MLRGCRATNLFHSGVTAIHPRIAKVLEIHKLNNGHPTTTWFIIGTSRNVAILFYLGYVDSAEWDDGNPHNFLRVALGVSPLQSLCFGVPVMNFHSFAGGTGFDATAASQHCFSSGVGLSKLDWQGKHQESFFQPYWLPQGFPCILTLYCHPSLSSSSSISSSLPGFEGVALL